MKNCVYRIINVKNNKVYIGSTINAERRKLEHFSQLEHSVHINDYLQRSYNKYGKDAFIFNVIESNLKEDELLKKEQHYINLFNSSNSNFGYNISEYASRPDGRKYTKLYTVKIRDILERNKLSMGALSLFLCLQLYLERYTNKVVTSNNKTISNKEMKKIMKCSELVIIKSLTELESHNIIKRVGRSQAREIYLNPYLVTLGCEVQQYVYDMFKEL